MVRELFVMAREHAPSIIFMDEIDSIGSSRGEGGGGGGDSEVQRTMLELLNQLDGFEGTKNIKVSLEVWPTVQGEGGNDWSTCSLSSAISWFGSLKPEDGLNVELTSLKTEVGTYLWSEQRNERPLFLASLPASFPILIVLSRLFPFYSSGSQVIMATNRIDILDSALLRPGRIDRKIEFPPPGPEARVSILRIHSRKVSLIWYFPTTQASTLIQWSDGASN